MSVPFKPCKACGKDVHPRALACTCGATSPWPKAAAKADAIKASSQEIGTEPQSDADLPGDEDPQELGPSIHPVMSLAEAIEYLLPRPAPVQLPVVDPALAGAYVVKGDFRMQIGSTLAELKAGRVVTEPSLIRVLLDQGAPIVPAAEAGSIIACPHCRGLFKPETAIRRVA